MADSVEVILNETTQSYSLFLGGRPLQGNFNVNLQEDYIPHPLDENEVKRQLVFQIETTGVAALGDLLHLKSRQFDHDPQIKEIQIHDPISGNAQFSSAVGLESGIYQLSYRLPENSGSDPEANRYIMQALYSASDFLPKFVFPQSVLVEYHAANADRSIGENLTTGFARLGKVVDDALEAMQTSRLQSSFTFHFDFPASVKVACEQYLVYFAEFLKDVGVTAAADIKHTANEVLFTVTPENPAIALDKVREALNLYLQLPQNPASSVVMPSPEIPLEVQRLGVTIQHLQTQISFANMMLKTQQATIEAQQVTIDYLQQTPPPPQMITAEVFVDAVRAITSTSKDSDKEKFLGGTLELTKYESKAGVNVNLAQLYRHLRDYFAKDKEDGRETG